VSKRQYLKESDTLDAIFEKRLKQVQPLVHGFSEVLREEVTLNGVRAIQSTQTFSMPELGTFQVKEVTVVHNNTYYLILGQCIEPDDYGRLEKDFNEMFQSFGFIQ
jgi:hypothetical protein